MATITPSPLRYDSDPTPKANRLGEETTTHQPVLPDAALGLDRCMEHRLGWVQDPGGVYSTRALKVGGVPLLSPTLIPSSTLSG